VCGEDSVRDLAVNIRAVHHGEALVSSRMAGAMMARLTTLAQQCPAPIPEESQFAALSAREQEVLALMSEGCTNRDIAQRLVIGVGTAKNHAHRIFRKLEVNSREEAIRLWLSRDGCGGCSQVDSIGPDSSRGIRLPEESAVN
jgi:DNA-binding NarL/FixJ family response regulator